MRQEHTGRPATPAGERPSPPTPEPPPSEDAIRQPPFPPTPGPPLAELDFDGAYRRFRLPTKDLEHYEGRLEFWDRATQTALEVREPTSPYHERPSQLLSALAERIAQVRGKPIRCYGTMDLVLLGEDDEPTRLMQADQSLYLYPERANLVGPSAMVVGTNHYPDVVLEVDFTTDVRRHKLKLYEAWGFPELWVQVPDTSRRPSRVHGLTIHVLGKDGFQEAEESAAFPGWAAEDIHRAFNEEPLSEYTCAILERIGRVLGEREGTGPDDDPLLRSQRQQARQEAREGELERRGAMVYTIMATRHLDVPANFPLGTPGFAEAPVRGVVETAMSCASAAEFTAWLRGHAPRPAPTRRGPKRGTRGPAKG